MHKKTKWLQVTKEVCASMCLGNVSSFTEEVSFKQCYILKIISAYYISQIKAYEYEVTMNMSVNEYENMNILQISVITKLSSLK